MVGQQRRAASRTLFSAEIAAQPMISADYSR
jgi:hypothetical protein